MTSALLTFFTAGNKSDLEAQRQVLFEDACTLAENNNVLASLETSAKEAQNVDAAFVLMARELLARNGMNTTDEAIRDSPRLILSNSSQPIHGAASSDKKCGCWADWHARYTVKYFWENIDGRLKCLQHFPDQVIHWGLCESSCCMCSRFIYTHFSVSSTCFGGICR